MFFRRRPGPSEQISELDNVVASALPNADAETLRIVTAITALLGTVGYADRDLTAPEITAIVHLLQTVHGLGPTQAERLVHALRTHLISVTTLETPRHTRALVELTDRDLRLHVLDLLIQVSAADGVISHNEVVVMRQLTTALGLDQADYNALQNSHRHKLSSLRDAED